MMTYPRLALLLVHASLYVWTCAYWPIEIKKKILCFVCLTTAVRAYAKTLWLYKYTTPPVTCVRMLPRPADQSEGKKKERSRHEGSWYWLL